MKHRKYLRKTLSFLLAFISASVFVSQGLVFDAGKVDAAVDSFKLFGVGTGLTAKEFVDNIGRYAKNMSGYKYGLTGTRYDSSETTLDCISFVELIYKLACGTAKGKGASASVAPTDNWRSDIKYYKEPSSTEPVNISSWTVTAKDIYGLCKPYSHNLRAFRSDVLDNPSSGVSHSSFTDVKNAKYYSDRVIDGEGSSNKSEADKAWKSLMSGIKFSDGTAGASNGDIMIFYEDGCTSYSDIALHVGIYYEIDGVPGLYHCSDSKGVTYVKNGDKVSYKVTKDSSTGHYGVRWEALSDGISKDVALTHLAAYKTVDQEYPVNVAFFINKTYKNNLFTGAEFTVFEEDKSTVRGKISDNDGNGVYSNYKDVSGESYLCLGKVSSDQTSLANTFYVKESKIPSEVVTGSGTFRAKEDYSDKSLYKIDVSFKAGAQDPSSGTLTYKVSGGSLKETVTVKVSDYSASDSYKDNSNKIRLSNNSDDYVKFDESLWLELTKKTNDAKIYDTKVTKLTLRKADNTALAHYMYSDSGWGWYLNDGAAYYGKYYPLMADSDYKITETYTVPLFHCYDGKTISYKVSNNDWKDKTYLFSTAGRTLGDLISISCTNTVDSSYFKLKKNVNYGTKEGFEFTLLTVDRSKTLAKGISDSKGNVNWKYYGTSSDSLTESTSITLPQGNYRLEEKIPDPVVTSYGAGMHYDVPKGFTLDPSGKYAYRNISVDESGLELTADNNLPFGEISGSKSVPAGNRFDPASVKFALYYDRNGNERSDSGDSLITTGTVDGKGNIVWKDDVKHLAYGRYIVSEEWTPDTYSYADGSRGDYLSQNGSGWTKVSDNRYEKAFEINDEKRSFSFKVVNSEDSGDLSVTKTFLTEGDVSITEFELLFKGKVIAKGSASPSGHGGYSTEVTWAFGGKKVKTMKLPAGEYEIREYIPESFYKKTSIRYSYAVPKGWERSSDSKYFYKKVTVSKDSTCNVEAENVMEKGNLTINKTDEAEGTDKEFIFHVYWRGNGKSPADIGVFDEAHLLDTINVSTKADNKGQGSYTLKDVPFGFYEIREQIPDGYILAWDQDTDINGIVHVSDPRETGGGSISATNKINITVRAVKSDAWTGKMIFDPGQFSKNRHLKYTLYEDLDSDGILDENEIPTGREVEDKDNDGIILFSNVGKGDYLLKETGTVDGYYLSDSVSSFSVKTSDDIVLYPQDMPYAVPLKIEKTDLDDKSRLSGAVFELYVDSNNDQIWDKEDRKAMVKAGDELVEAMISETSEGIYECNGLLHFNDGSEEFGHSYILVERKAPEGYFFVKDGVCTADNTAVVFAVAAADCEGKDFKVSTVKLSIANKTGTVKVIKSDEEGLFIPGALFAVYRDMDKKELLATFSDSNGQYSYKGLGCGTYYLAELEAPAGYEADPAVYPFEITCGSPDVRVENKLAVKYGQEGKFVNCTIHTSARDARFKNEYEMMLSDDDDAVITDRVYYDGLITGREYVLEGTVLYARDAKKADGSCVKAGSVCSFKDGTPFTAKRTFVAGKDGEFVLSEDKLMSEGYIEIDIHCDASSLSKDLIPVVISEKLYRKDTGALVGSHKDLKAIRQTVIPVGIQTELTYSDGLSHIVPVAIEAGLTDKVSCRNLSCGKRYKLTGFLVDTKTGEKYLDPYGKEVRSSVEFTVTKERAKNTTAYNYTDEQNNSRTELLADIDVDVTFVLDTTDLEGKSVTAFEYLYVEEDGKYIPLASHEDISAKGQTVTVDKNIPRLKTVLSDKASATKTVSYGKKIVLEDSISYDGLCAGTEYTMEGLLFDKTEGKHLESNGKPVTTTLVFVPESEKGTVVMHFEVDSTVIAGHDLVAFEILKRGGVIVASHCEAEDADQTVSVPSCKTNASTDKGSKLIESMRKAVIIDSVEYKGLTPGQDYCIVATLYTDKGPSLVRTDGSLLETKVNFTPLESDGKIDVSIVFSNNSLEAGTVIVVFEDIYLNDYRHNGEDILVTCHRDLACKEQSIGVKLPPTGETAPASEKITVMMLMILSTSVFLDIKNRRCKKS